MVDQSVFPDVYLVSGCHTYYGIQGVREFPALNYLLHEFRVKPHKKKAKL